MWTREKIRLQTSCFISLRYSVKHSWFYWISRFCHNAWLMRRLHTGAAQVLEGLSRLYQRGDARLGWAALQDQSSFRQVAVCHDPQNAEGAGSCWPDTNHEPWRLEEGKMKMWNGYRWHSWECPLQSPLFCLIPAAHHLLLQRTEWHHNAGGQNRLPESHFKVAIFWLQLLWSKSESWGRNSQNWV